MNYAETKRVALGIRLIVFVYGLACYLVFFATLLYAIGFIGNLVVPKSIDAGAQGSLLTALLPAKMIS